MRENFNTIDEYIATFPDYIQKIMVRVRKTIMDSTPDVVESISWGMPTFKTHERPLVYFAGHKHHLGFYGTPTIQAEFADELAGYKQGKGSVQFPYDKQVPFELIRRIVEFRIKENSEKHKAKNNRI
jgi:uncharacterized protein YdhG (YjbR/CyaY superfamily)